MDFSVMTPAPLQLSGFIRYMSATHHGGECSRPLQALGMENSQCTHPEVYVITYSISVRFRRIYKIY